MITPLATPMIITKARLERMMIVFLVFFGLELVFRVLDEAKLPHTNYPADEIALVSIFGMPRRLYLDLPLHAISCFSFLLFFVFPFIDHLLILFDSYEMRC